MENKTINTVISKIISKTILSLALLTLTACSTYPNKFKCGDAKGLGCTMLREVDTQIRSGKIDEAYKLKKKCSGGNCSSDSSDSKLNDDIPQHLPTHKAVTTNLESEDNDDISDLNNLYF